MSTDRGRTGDAVGSTEVLGRGRNTGGSYRAAGPDPWYRYNRSIRFYGLTFLVGTKLADVVTTVVGMRYIPSIVEANPVANRLFTEMGLVTGLTVLGFATVLFAACAAELFGVEVRRRYGLPKTALFAQASIYLILSVLFGLVALHNATLIADQTTYMLDGMLAPAR